MFLILLDVLNAGTINNTALTKLKIVKSIMKTAELFLFLVKVFNLFV